MDDELILQESIETGVVSFKLSGDINRAKLHMHEARKILASVKNSYGIDEAIAAGDSGGFYFRNVTLNDGTKIQAITNDGMDMVRIESPPQTDEPTNPDEEKKPVIPIQSFIGDIWVGARIVSGGDGIKNPDQTDDAKIHLCLWEPHNTAGKDGYIIVSNRDDLLTENELTEDEDVFPLRPFAQVENDSNFEVLLDQQEKDGDWDVVIKSKKIATPGKYSVKLMLHGDECERREPAEIELKIKLVDYQGNLFMGGSKDISMEGQTFDTEAFITRYKMGMLPYGWFYDEYKSTLSDNCDLCGVPEDDRGTNPHAAHWWQGVASIFLPPPHEYVNEVDAIQPVVSFKEDGYEVDEDDTPGFEPRDWVPLINICNTCNTESVSLHRIRAAVNFLGMSEKPLGNRIYFPQGHQSYIPNGMSVFNVIHCDHQPGWERFLVQMQNPINTGMSKGPENTEGFPSSATFEGEVNKKKVTRNLTVYDSGPLEVITDQIYLFCQEVCGDGTNVYINCIPFGLGAQPRKQREVAMTGLQAGESCFAFLKSTFTRTVNEDGVNTVNTTWEETDSTEWLSHGGTYEGSTTIIIHSSCSEPVPVWYD